MGESLVDIVRVFSAVLLRVPGPILIGVGAWHFFHAVETGRGFARIPTQLVALAVVAFGAFFHLSARRIASGINTRRYARVLPTSVLYLRPFKTAGVAILGSGVLNWILRAFTSGPEERMLTFLWSLGAVTTVRRPADVLPELAARDVAIPEEMWQPKVLELIRKADFVVVRLSDSPNVGWELRTAASNKRLTHILLWFSPIDTWGRNVEESRWQELRYTLQEHLGASLPESVARGSFISFDSNKLAIVSNSPLPFIRQQEAGLRNTVVLSGMRLMESFVFGVLVMMGWYLAAQGVEALFKWS